MVFPNEGFWLLAAGKVKVLHSAILNFIIIYYLNPETLIFISSFTI